MWWPLEGPFSIKCDTAADDEDDLLLGCGLLCRCFLGFRALGFFRGLGFLLLFRALCWLFWLSGGGFLLLFTRGGGGCCLLGGRLSGRLLFRLGGFRGRRGLALLSGRSLGLCGGGLFGRGSPLLRRLLLSLGLLFRLAGTGAQLERTAGSLSLGLDQGTASDGRLEVLLNKRRQLFNIYLVSGSHVLLDGLQRRSATLLQVSDGCVDHVRCFRVRGGGPRFFRF